MCEACGLTECEGCGAGLIQQTKDQREVVDRATRREMNLERFNDPSDWDYNPCEGRDIQGGFSG